MQKRDQMKVQLHPPWLNDSLGSHPGLCTLLVESLNGMPSRAVFSQVQIAVRVQASHSVAYFCGSERKGIHFLPICFRFVWDGIIIVRVEIHPYRCGAYSYENLARVVPLCAHVCVPYPFRFTTTIAA